MNVQASELKEGMRFAEWKVITDVKKKGRRVLVTTLDDMNDIVAVSDFNITQCPFVCNVMPDGNGGYVIEEIEEMVND